MVDAIIRTTSLRELSFFVFSSGLPPTTTNRMRLDESMAPSSFKLADSSARAPDRPSEVKGIPPVRPKRRLEDEIQELKLKLTVAQEALRREQERCKFAEMALGESEQKYQRRMDEYNVIIQGLQSQMEQTRKLQELGTIVTPVLAHDLKNLLAAISSVAQLCVERMNPVPPLEEHLRMIYENSQKANRLIVNFLDFARIVKYDRPTAQPLDLHDIIRKIWKVAESASAPLPISFVTRFDRRLPRIMGDAEKMERLFLNLFLNAIQAIRKKGRVTVSTQFLPSERAIQILISDNGTGIPKKYQEKIFEPFFTTKERGTGLGLSACRAIILQFGGNIRLDSTPGRGTKVYIRFPVVVGES